MPRHHRWLAACWLAAIAGITILVSGGPAHASTGTAPGHSAWAGPNQTSSYSASYLVAPPANAAAQAISLLPCEEFCKPPTEPCKLCKPPTEPCKLCKPPEPCKEDCKPPTPCKEDCKPPTPCKEDCKPPTPCKEDCKPPTPPVKPPVKPSPPAELPVTGTPVGLVTGAGFTLVALGAGVLWRTRRSIRP
jgi:hypothetical protein